METIKKMSLSAIEDRLSMHEMEEIQAGSLNCANINSRGTQLVGLICSIGCSGPGILVFGPTALAIGIASVYCAGR